MTTPTHAEIEATAKRLHKVLFPAHAIIRGSDRFDACLHAAKAGWTDQPRTVLASEDRVWLALLQHEATHAMDHSERKDFVDALRNANLIGERPPTETQLPTRSDLMKLPWIAGASTATAYIHIEDMIAAGYAREDDPEPEPMSDVERVARAIHKTTIVGGGNWDTAPNQPLYLEMARAAIAAIAQERTP